MKLPTLAATLLALPASLLADDACLTPVEMAQPASELEIRQPYRLAFEVMTARGYPLLIIKPSNRYPLHTIRGDRFEELGAGAFPKTGLWQYRNIVQGRDGTVYGFGTTSGSGKQQPALYRLDPTSRRFVHQATPPFSHGSYNPHLDRILLMTIVGELVEWDGQSAVLSKLNGLPKGQNLALPRYVPALNGFLAAVEDTLFIRSDREGSSWRVLGAGSERVSYYQLGKAFVHVDPAQAILAIRLGSRMLVYNLTDNGLPEFAYHVEDVARAAAQGEGPVLVEQRHRATRPGRLARWLGATGKEAWKEALILTSEGAVSAAALPLATEPARLDFPAQSGVGKSPYHNNLHYTPPLFEIDKALHYFDGTSRIAVPHLAAQALGSYPRWFRWRDQLFVLSRNKGWGQLQPDLSLQFHDFPVPVDDNNWKVSITASDVFGGLVVVDPRAKGAGAIWSSADGQSFSPLAGGAAAGAREYLADIPGQTSGLVLADGGLLLLQKHCHGE